MSLQIMGVAKNFLQNGGQATELDKNQDGNKEYTLNKNEDGSSFEIFDFNSDGKADMDVYYENKNGANICVGGNFYDENGDIHKPESLEETLSYLEKAEALRQEAQEAESHEVNGFKDIMLSLIENSKIKRGLAQKFESITEGIKTGSANLIDEEELQALQEEFEAVREKIKDSTVKFN